MKTRAFHLALLTLVLAALACGNSPALDQAGPTIEAGLLTAVPTLQSGFETTIPTLQAEAATVGPALQTIIPPGLVPGQGLPLPGTLIPQMLNDLNQEQAALALEAYGREVLGVSVDITTARSATISDLNLPVTTESGATQAMQLAGVSYYGLFKDGTASLSLGSGSTSGADLTGSIENASLGIFSTSLLQNMPANAAEALALVKSTYPGITGLDLITVEETGGFTFQTSQAQDWSIANGQITLQGTMINAGVNPGRRAGRVVVWVTVASGILAAPFSK